MSSIAVKNSAIKLDNTLKKGNLAIGFNDIEYGPTPITGFYTAISIPNNGYVIYETNSSGRLRMYRPQNNTEFIDFIKKLGGDVTTIDEALSYVASNPNLFALNRPIGDIVTDNLLVYYDATQINSYPKNGNTWYNMGDSTNNATLINGPVYDTDNGGNIFFDGSNDYMTLDNDLDLTDWSISYWQELNFTRDYRSTPILFYNRPPAGAATEGNFDVVLTQFHSISTVMVDSSDNIYVGGQYGGYNDIVRDTLVKINPDGTPNTQFNSGRAITNGTVVGVNKIQQLSNGNLMTVGTNWGLGGISTYNSTTGVFISQPTNGSGGSIATSFILSESTNSLYILDSWLTTYQGQDVTGKIIKVDPITYTIDTNFISSSGFKSAVGKVTVSTTEGVYGGIVLSDGGLLCYGAFREYKGVPATRIVKINPNTGALDTSFVYGSGFNFDVFSAVQLNNGIIVVAGAFTNYNGTSINGIVGLNLDGTINSSFNVGFGIGSGAVDSLVYDSVNDKLFCLGRFTSFNGTTSNYVIKLNSNGSVDTSFNVGTGFNSATSGGALDSQGRLVVVGNTFTTYNGADVPLCICRINSNGTLDTTFTSIGFNIRRFRNDATTRLSDGSNPFVTGFYGIANNRQITDQLNGIMYLNGLNNYTITFDSATKTFNNYINGYLGRTATVAATMNLKSRNLGFFNGISNFMIYDKVLTQEEVWQNHAGTAFEFFRNRVIADSGTLLTNNPDSSIQNALKYNPSFVNLADAVKQNKLYSLKPINDAGSGDLILSRNGQATYFDKDGILRYATNNEPRFQYDPLTGEYMGILIEHGATNLLVRSQEFDNAAWTTYGTILQRVANQAIAPDDTLTADLIEYPSSGQNLVRRTSISIINNYSYSLSLFVKNNTFNQNANTITITLNNNQVAPNNFILSAAINFQTETATFTLGGTSGTGFSGSANGRLVKLKNGWYRLEVNGKTGSAAATSIASFEIGTNNQGGSCYIWGAQMEISNLAVNAPPDSPATSYIPTVASQVLRPGDTIEKTGMLDLFGQEEGTIFMEFTRTIPGSTDIIRFAQDSLSYTNSILLTFTGSGLLQYIIRYNNLNGPLKIVANTNNVNNFKIALRYRSGSTRIAVNGVLDTTINTSFAFTSPLTRIIIDQAQWTGLNQNRAIKSIALFRRGLSDSELTALTAN